MKLTLENVGKVESADIDVCGITVIAGANNSGKSTIGKALYCLFTAFHNIDEEIEKSREKLVHREIGKYAEEPSYKRASMSMINSLCSKAGKDGVSFEEVKDVLRNFLAANQDLEETILDEDIEKMASGILQILQKDNKEIMSNVLKQVLFAEFNGQLGHIGFPDEKTSICLQLKNSKIDVTIQDNQIDILSNLNITSSIVYLDDPFIVDSLDGPYFYFTDAPYRHPSNRNSALRRMLKTKKRASVENVMSEMQISEKLNHIFEVINTACAGQLERDEGEFVYKKSGYQAAISLTNISAGIKSFLILKTLLLNGSIKEGGTIILDEPEIHLHPEWQLTFAELIVLLHKEFGLHILLTTHSPYFLRAIEVYSAKYSIADECKYYAINTDYEKDRATVQDVTENTEKIYKELAGPLQKLEDLRWE